MESQVVTPWTVQGNSNNGIDYDKLLNQFGCQRITPELVDRIEMLTKRPAHFLLKRCIFFAHRDLVDILDAYERGEEFYIYTGRGPSSCSMTLGHLVPFMFCKYLQDAFGAKVIIQLSDDEKYLWKDLTIEDCSGFAKNNIKDIIACGFDPEKTFIFTNLDYVGGAFYKNILRVQKHITMNQVKGAFGLSGEDSIGKIAFPAVQIAPCLSNSFPEIFGENANNRCLIPCAIDQDPYFRVARDLAPRLKYHKPSLIESQFLPSLRGHHLKMSSSDQNSAIYLDDSPGVVKSKIKKYAFSGGRETIEMHRKHGADLSVDIPWKYLQFFMLDDNKLRHIGEAYSSGDMLTGEIKAILVDVVNDLLAMHQDAKAKLSDDTINRFIITSPS